MYNNMDTLYSTEKFIHYSVRIILIECNLQNDMSHILIASPYRILTNCKIKQTNKKSNTVTLQKKNMVDTVLTE